MRFQGSIHFCKLMPLWHYRRPQKPIWSTSLRTLISAINMSYNNADQDTVGEKDPWWLYINISSVVLSLYMSLTSHCIECILRMLRVFPETLITCWIEHAFQRTIGTSCICILLYVKVSVLMFIGQFHLGERPKYFFIVMKIEQIVIFILRII